MAEMTCGRDDGKQGTYLLEEAVTQNNILAVKTLLEKESREKDEGKINPNNRRPSHNLPFLIATNEGNLDIINAFRNYDYNIYEPHLNSCICEDCHSDKLGQTRHRLLTLKALGNPVWLSLTSKDPFLTLFKLNETLEKHRYQNDSFQKEYDEMHKANEQLSMDLLAQIKDEEEGLILMKYKVSADDLVKNGDLPFINLAIEYQEKEVVAYPVVQHFLTAKVFSGLPRWETSGIVYKMFFVLLLAILYPVTTLINTFSFSKCPESIRKFAAQPLVKFVNGAASFITFLILLLVFAASERDGIRAGDSPTGIDIAILLWVIGFSFGEFKQLYRSGINSYLGSGWNWVDVGMDALMLFSFATWIVIACLNTDDNDEYTTIRHVADGAFTIAIVLSFFRIVYLCQITSYLGLLQLCLGEMVMVIFQFAFICIIVLLAFSVAMSYLINASEKGQNHLKSLQEQYANKSAIMASLNESFNGFVSTMFTMTYVSLSMGSRQIIDEDFADGSLIHLWGTISFLVYFAITMIVVLNMLIAMMNNSYQRIADNLLTEHMYSRTTLWMEYTGNENSRPVPFNLIPSISFLQSIFHCLSKIFRCSSCLNYCDQREDTNSNREAEKKYEKLCRDLLERYMRLKYGRTIDECDESAIVNETISNTPLMKRINLFAKIEKPPRSKNLEHVMLNLNN